MTPLRANPVRRPDDTSERRAVPCGLGHVRENWAYTEVMPGLALSCFTISGTFLSNYLARLTAMLTTRSMPLPARTRQRPVLSPDTRSDLVPFSANKTCQIIRRSTPQVPVHE